MSEEIIVLKFGSSVLRSKADLPNAVHEIYRWVRIGYRVIAVASAIGDATDQLLGEAGGLTSTPEPFATAELLATGERASAALLGIALDRAGLAARTLNPREIGLTVAGCPLDSELLGVDLEKLRMLLAEYPVLVLPGFFGTDIAGRTHLLGRGGSDLSAVFLAHTLGARCRLLKDVDGVYESDPSETHGILPRRFAQLDYESAHRVAGPLIQPRAVAFLQENAGRAEVAALARSYESVVHCGPAQHSAAAPVRALKVLLLGLGTVGFGVYQRLLANPDRFEVLGALVRERAKHERLGVPVELLHTNPVELRHVLADIVVDALTGIEPAHDVVSHFLETGAHVVSTNKDLIAEHGASLAARARCFGTHFRYGAAIGGATPMIEIADRIAADRAIVKLTAALNGTCDIILDACAAGASLTEVIADARSEGFAEGDLASGTWGCDAARELRILCRHAFRAEPDMIEVQTLDESVANLATDAAAAGQRLHQVARATREAGRVRAQLTFEVLGPECLLGRLSRGWNALEIECVDGQMHCVTGRAAGRWPVTESVMADLFEFHRDCDDRTRTAPVLSRQVRVSQ